MNLWSNTISNEYDYSPSMINFHVDSHHYLSQEGLNNAEIDAMNAEREREDNKRKQREEYEKNMSQYKKNNSQYLLKKEEGKSIAVINRLENEKKKLNKMVYNATIRQSNLNKMVNQKNKETNDKEKINDKDIMQPQSQKKKKNKQQPIKNNEEKEEISIKTEEINANDNDKNRDNEIIDKGQIDQAEVKEEKNNVIIDIRSTLEGVVHQKLQSQKTKCLKSILEEEKNTFQEIKLNLKHLLQFREKGAFEIKSTSKGNNITEGSSKPQEQQESLSKPNTTNPNVYKQTKLDKKRFNLALKKILIEKLGERNIKVPSICNCGQLQKNLDTILSVKNNSVYSVFKPTCANNCLYYNKRNEYEKSIQDILTSIRLLKFDSFNNKY